MMRTGLGRFPRFAPPIYASDTCLRYGVRRLVAAFKGEIHFAFQRDCTQTVYDGYGGPMNWPVQGGDESPHSTSEGGTSEGSRSEGTPVGRECVGGERVGGEPFGRNGLGGRIRRGEVIYVPLVIPTSDPALTSGA